MRRDYDEIDVLVCIVYSDVERKGRVITMVAGFGGCSSAYGSNIPVQTAGVACNMPRTSSMSLRGLKLMALVEREVLV